MKKRKRPTRGASDRRARAESQLTRRTRPRKTAPSATGARRLGHELEVNQVELELQNEEPRSSRHEVEVGLERYAELFDFAPIGYAVLGADETISAVNHAGAHLLGRARSHLMHRRFHDLVALRDRPALIAILRMARGGDAEPSCEVELTVDLEPKTVVRLTATMLSRPEPTFLLAFFDITAERRKTVELAQAERALRQENARKDEFLAMLSHELRNPLTPIRSSLALLDPETPDAATVRKAREVIDRQVTHLTRIIDDLLDITRITRGKVQLERVRLDVGALVKSVVEDHRRSFEEQGLTLDVRVHGGQSWIDADPTRIMQVLSNLLGNARKYTPQGGRVDVRVRRAGGRVELQVSDTGAGIAPDMLARVFEPFAQAPQLLDRSSGGLGLGLAMAKRLVEMHGGEVTIASGGLGRGAAVTVRLPLVSAPATAAARAPARARPGRRVVVIEDHHDTADGLKVMLSMRGHEVRVAYDGATGLDVVRAFRPEVVICDLGLPGIDGYSLATILRSDRALGRICLIALSGYARPEDLRRATAAGFDRHVAKPPDFDALDRVIGEVCGASADEPRRPRRRR